MICAMILAAGKSRRMGTQKLLLPFGGGTVIGHIANEILASPVERAFAVVGDDRGPVASSLADRGVAIVVNPDPDGDILSSVRQGLLAIPKQCRAVLVALGDQPSVKAGLICSMIAAFDAPQTRDDGQGRTPHGAGCGIVVPAYGGRRGHPILFSTCYSQEVLTQYDSVGLCGLLAAHADDVLALPAGDSSVLSDMDLPEDYRRELARLRDDAGTACG